MSNKFEDTITITLGDQAENHVGMQKIGKLADEGFNYDDLVFFRKYFKELNVKAIIYDLKIDELSEEEFDAYILIIRNGISFLDNYSSNDLYYELKELNWDKKAFMYGRVVNKKARHNLCFGVDNQDADYESGKGTIISYKEVPILHDVLNFFSSIHYKCKGLVAEGNHYYDIETCGIGFHGDSERKKVIGIRLGATIPLEFQWFYKSYPIGDRLSFNLKHGDIYIMSQKTTGNDWKTKNIPTLRHAAGVVGVRGSNTNTVL
jgi:hypothetical protein